MPHARALLLHVLSATTRLVAADLFLVQLSVGFKPSRQLESFHQEGKAGASTCVPNTTDVDADWGGAVAVDVPPGLLQGAEARCKLGLAWDGWVLTGGDIPSEREERSMRATVSNGGSQVLCEVPAFPSAAEGPVTLHVTFTQTSRGANVTKACSPMPLWYSTRLAASFGETPYFAQQAGELLVRTNASEAEGPLQLRALGPNAEVLADAQVKATGKTVLPVSFLKLPPFFNESVRVELSRNGTRLANRSLRLQLVPTRKRGSSAVDHKRRGLIVDGRPFLPVGWFSFYLKYGVDETVKSFVDLARRGINAIMLYNLIAGPPGSRIFGDRGEAPASPGQILDAAAALGIKVQVYLLDITRPLSKGDTAGWEILEKVVKSWRHHPAILAWYIADDDAGPFLPEVYARIKRLDPFHIVTMAIAGSGDAFRRTYTQGSDVIMVETYSPLADFAFASMNVIRRWPLEFMPTVTCGRAWSIYEDNAVVSPEVFSSQFYHALIAGSTGEQWFALSSSEGWNEPGIALQAAAYRATQQFLDLAPALASSGDYSEASIPPMVTASARLLGGKPAGPTAVRAKAFREETGCVTVLLANGLNTPVEAVVNFTFGATGIFDERTQQTEALVPFDLSLPVRRVPVDSGILLEWLPALGVQAFRLNGSSACAVPELLPGQLERPNLLVNPSFEESGGFISAPFAWACGEGTRSSSACFSDASTRLDRRRSGRFATGLDASAFSVAPEVAWPKENASGAYAFSIWAQADVPMTLELLFGGRVQKRRQLGEGWTRLEVGLNVSKGESLRLKVNTTGVLWLDNASLIKVGELDNVTLNGFLSLADRSAARGGSAGNLFLPGLLLAALALLQGPRVLR